MIGAGTHIPTPKDAPTGGWDTGGWDNMYCYSVPATPERPDPRKNPKNWALWFREFLALVCLRCEQPTIRATRIVYDWLAGQVRCRSGTLPTREWKMKDWVQALRAS